MISQILHESRKKKFETSLETDTEQRIEKENNKKHKVVVTEGIKDIDKLNEIIDKEIDDNFSKSVVKPKVPAFLDFEKKDEMKPVEESEGNTNEISTDDEMRKELKNDNK